LQAKALLATVRPRDIAGKTRRRMVADEIADLVAVDANLKKLKAERLRSAKRAMSPKSARMRAAAGGPMPWMFISPEPRAVTAVFSCTLTAPARCRGGLAVEAAEACAPGAPHRTNDLDGDERRRTPRRRRDRALDTAGSQIRAR
jgi:hypothetical protein